MFFFQKWYDEVLDILKNLANFSLFLELHFLMQSLSTIILFTWFIVPYFYLAEHMTRIGFTEQQASFVISVIGFTNTIGMVRIITLIIIFFMITKFDTLQILDQEFAMSVIQDVRCYLSIWIYLWI